jgi:hypothetical protein
MSTMDARYRVDEPAILAEEITGEVLAIDNRTGAYVSITGTGVEIWNLLALGHTPAEAAEALAANHGAEVADVEPVVLTFVERLLETKLIIVAERSVPDAAATRPGDAPTPFTEPTLDVYTDMEELLLFDPIHDVSEQGWPDIQPGAQQR